jgi:hypothetical protein
MYPAVAVTIISMVATVVVHTKLPNFRTSVAALLFLVIAQLLVFQAKAQTSTTDLINACRSWGVSNQVKIEACSKLYEQGNTYKWLFMVYGKQLDGVAKFVESRDVYAKGSRLFPKDVELASLLKISQSKVKETGWKRQVNTKSGPEIATNDYGDDVELQVRCQLAKDLGIELPDGCQPAVEKNKPVEPIPQVVKVQAPPQADKIDIKEVTSAKQKQPLDETPALDRDEIGTELSSLKAEIAKLKEQMSNSKEKPEEKPIMPDTRRRVALVIGNSRYKYAGALVNTLNDAKGIGRALKETGFDVTVKTDVKDATEFIALVRQYYKKLAKDKQTVGFFYYAGHAVQVDGINYLIPVSSDIQNKADLSRTAISLSYVSDMAAEANNTMNMFVVDACRNNPFRSLSRSIQGGLANVRAPVGSLIVYAAGPGRVAMDGDGKSKNSPFSKSLIKHLDTPNKHVLLMLQNVIKDVREDTQGFQQPWVQSSLSGDFYFNRQ